MIYVLLITFMIINNMTTCYEYERYICDKETLRETIETFGVAIIPNVLDEIECETMLNKIWDFLEHITQSWEIPIDRNKIETWNEFYKLYPSHSMLLQHWGVGHTQACWDVRQNIKIVEIFAYFWGCSSNDLLVSFDGLSFHLPPEITKRGGIGGIRITIQTNPLQLLIFIVSKVLLLVWILMIMIQHYHLWKAVTNITLNLEIHI